MAIDQFGRNIHYLRISLTDHCNLRCVYCMPEDQTFRPNPQLMQDNEIALLTRLFASLGFDKIRLTGGEPTVRAHIVDIVRGIASTEGIRSVSMTTNGVLLKKLAAPLAEAGLRRVNVSVDTLDAEKFHRLTRWGKLDDVWAGILAAEIGCGGIHRLDTRHKGIRPPRNDLGVGRPTQFNHHDGLVGIRGLRRRGIRHERQPHCHDRPRSLVHAESSLSGNAEGCVQHIPCPRERGTQGRSPAAAAVRVRPVHRRTDARSTFAHRLDAAWIQLRPRIHLPRFARRARP